MTAPFPEDHALLDRLTRLEEVPNDLDPEAAQLAESWQTLGQLLEGQRIEVPTAAVVEAVQRRAVRHRRRRLMRTWACAAAILVSVGLAYWQASRWHQPAPVPVATAELEPIEEEPWTDELDEELALLRVWALGVEQRWRQPPSMAAAIRNDLNRLEYELAGNSL